MVIKVSIPNRLQFKVIPGIRNVLFAKRGDIHYIGGADVLPPPLEAEEEQMVIEKLSTEEGTQAKTTLIERNLRLVVYIAKKFDNTGVGVEDLISIGTIGLIKSINTAEEVYFMANAEYTTDLTALDIDVTKTCPNITWSKNGIYCPKFYLAVSTTAPTYELTYCSQDSCDSMSHTNNEKFVIRLIWRGNNFGSCRHNNSNRGKALCKQLREQFQ